MGGSKRFYNSREKRKKERVAHFLNPQGKDGRLSIGNNRRALDGKGSGWGESINFTVAIL